MLSMIASSVLALRMVESTTNSWTYLSINRNELGLVGGWMNEGEGEGEAP